MTFLKPFLIAVGTTLILDGLWLGVLAKEFYRKSIGSLMRMGPAGMEPVWASAAAVYVIIPLGVTLFAVPKAQGDPVKALLWGGLFGFVLYGVYEFTNHALLKGWPVSTVVVDLLWGTFLCAMVAFVVTYFS